MSCGGHQVARIHAELAGAVVADEADTFEPRRLPHPRPDEDRHPAAGGSGDRLEPLELAARFDGHGTDIRLDGGAELRLALAGTGEDDSRGRDAGAEGERQLATRCDVRTEAQPAQVADDRE